MNSNNREGKKIPFFRKISFKLALVVGLASLLASVVTMIITIPNSVSMVTELTQNEMRSMVTAYSGEMEGLFAENSEKNYEFYSAVLQNVKIEGVESSYAYLVDATGVMQYHPTQSMVGKIVETEFVKDLVGRIKRGEKLEPAVEEYLFNGETKFAGYAVLSDNSLLVITADENDILAATNQIMVLGIISTIGVTIGCTLIGVIIVLFTMKPLNVLTEVIEKTANFDFVDDGRSSAIAKRGDEIGYMGSTVAKMRGQLRKIVADIQEASDKIFRDVSMVNDVSERIRSECTDNSATTEQLAAGMEQTSATTGAISGNINEMKNEATDISKLSEDGVKLSGEITERALSLRESTNVAAKRTTDMYDTIKQQSIKAVEAAECVHQINAMTESIMQISSQTSLLALNASIEAARAGEAGKGFAVVASEISKLANETSDSVTNINNIVEQVNASVDDMVKSMEKTTQFLDEVVLKDYQQFKEVSDQYNNDADVVKDSMQKVETSVTTLTKSILEITDSIKGINSTLDDSTHGVTNISEKTNNVVLETSKNAELVDACRESVKKLEDIAKRFKI
ncbi:MAG: methyl-accepting chemotaxis protein [Lachnospiraceae bacterium]|nr:methyl-accepting chemotaxis protein [Lachnospiraceae bacterium]